MPKTTTRPMVRIHDLSTDEVIDREMNDLEFAEWENQQLQIAAANAAAAQKSADKAALLTQLGITEEQAKLLLS